jgi:hypothetical protein
LIYLSSNPEIVPMTSLGFSNPVRFGQIHTSDVQPFRPLVRHLPEGDCYFVPHTDLEGQQVGKTTRYVVRGHIEERETLREDGQPSKPCNCNTSPDLSVGEDPRTGDTMLYVRYVGEAPMIFEFNESGYTDEYSVVKFPLDA